MFKNWDRLLYPRRRIRFIRAGDNDRGQSGLSLFLTNAISDALH
jgi:hypothetical protein